MTYYKNLSEEIKVGQSERIKRFPFTSDIINLSDRKPNGNPETPYIVYESTSGMVGIGWFDGTDWAIAGEIHIDPTHYAYIPGLSYGIDPKNP